MNLSSKLRYIDPKTEFIGLSVNSLATDRQCSVATKTLVRATAAPRTRGRAWLNFMIEPSFIFDMVSTQTRRRPPPPQQSLERPNTNSCNTNCDECIGPSTHTAPLHYHYNSPTTLTILRQIKHGYTSARAPSFLTTSRRQPNPTEQHIAEHHEGIRTPSEISAKPLASATKQPSRIPEFSARRARRARGRRHRRGLVVPRAGSTATPRGQATTHSEVFLQLGRCRAPHADTATRPPGQRPRRWPSANTDPCRAIGPGADPRSQPSHAPRTATATA
jgi:hypothetical protein